MTKSLKIYKNKQEYCVNLKGESAYETYKSIEGNEDKTKEEFISNLGYECFKSIEGNENKTKEEFVTSFCGNNITIDTTTINQVLNIANGDNIGTTYNLSKGKYVILVQSSINEQVSTSGFIQLGFISNATVQRGCFKDDGLYRSYKQDNGYVGMMGYCYLESEQDITLTVYSANYTGSTKTIKTHGTIIKID